MKVLVTGARGLLGRAVMAELEKRNWPAVALGRAELDITDLAAVRQALAQHRPEVVVNCAAYTRVDQAEADYEAALKVNALGVRDLALACEEAKAVLVHISTDYVFPGDKEEAWGIYDERRPVNAYGKSKYLGERLLESLCSRYYLVRTSWLFGPGGPNFVDTILNLAREREEIAVVDDQRGCPTYSRDLARAVLDLAATGLYGTYHVTNQGVTTWYGFARRIVELAGAKVRVRPVSSSEFPRPARRPANSALDPWPLAETIGYLLPSWEDALARYLAERRN